MYKEKILSIIKDRHNQKNYIQWLFTHSKQYIWHIAGLIVLDVVISMIGIGTSVASKYVVDLASSSKGISFGVIMMITLTFASIAVSMSLSIASTIINEKYSFNIRINLYESILKTKLPKLASYKSGDLITRLTSDINSVTSGITSTVPDIITLSIQLVIAFFVLFHYDSSLALFALISGPVAVFASLFLAAKLKQLQVRVMESESAYNAFLHESMDNIVIIKSFSNEDDSVRKFTELRKKRFYWVLKRSKLTVFTNAVLGVAFSAGYLVAFISGAVKISNGLITFGTMTLFFTWCDKFNRLSSGLDGPCQVLCQYWHPPDV
jgi:ABC-type multidrug transport system fused ATPase/permease subunit